MTSSLRMWVALGGAVLATACSNTGDSRRSWNGTVRDSAGITIVENEDVPLWRDGDAWSFTKLERIGLREGPPEYQFGSLSGFVMLSDGRLVIADMHAHNLRFFTPDGQYLSSLGQRGEGPGEFSGYINLLLGPGDTVLAIDGRTSQASHIAPNGEWIGSFSTLPENGYQTAGWDDDETSREIVSLHSPLASEVDPEQRRTTLIIRRDLRGAYLDTLATLPAREAITGVGDARLWHNYRTGGDFDLCDGMLVTGFSDAYRFVWRRPDRSIASIATLDRARMPLTTEEQDLILRRLDYRSTRRGMSAAEIGWWKSRIRFEELYPAWRRFVCGPAGTILVQQVRRVSDFTETDLPLGPLPPGGPWEVFDREGRLLGAVSLPTEPHRHAFYRTGDGHWLMAGIETDELDVQYVGVWRIEGVEDR